MGALPGSSARCWGADMAFNTEGLLASIGRGLKLGAGVMNPQIYEEQGRERLLAEQQAQARKDQLFQLVFAGVQNGSIPQDQGKEILLRLRPELAGQVPEGAIGPTQDVLDARQQKQALQEYANSLQDPRARAAALAGQSSAAAKLELGQGAATSRSALGKLAEDYRNGLISPEEYAAAKRKALAPPSPLVNINNAGETAFSKEFSKAQATRLAGTIEAGNLAGTMEQSLVQLGQSLAQGVGTGSIQPALAGLQGVADDLGLDLTQVAKGAGIDLGKLSDKEEFDRLSKALAIDGFEKFKGNLNAQEVRMAVDAFPQLGKSEEGNRIAIASLMASARLAQERAAEASQITSTKEARLFEGAKARAGTQRFQELRKEILDGMKASKAQQGAAEAGIVEIKGKKYRQIGTDVDGVPLMDEVK